MDLIKWDEKYTVLRDDIDGEHRRLFALINELYKALIEGKGPEKSHFVLNELLEYTKSHFSHEEKILEDLLYSQVEQHKNAHSILIGQVKDLQDQLREGVELSRRMLEFLENWICQHILLVDQHYAEELGDQFRAE